jgi:pyruvate dehydrogenase E2 component (dihydrolipoamide acetyltransferase)
MERNMEIKMPKLGLTMTEGTLTRWLVREGQAVTQGDMLFEFESEKSTMEYEAPVDGVIGSLLVEPGTTIACGVPVAILETLAENAPDEKLVLETFGIHATPAAKRRARELGVDLVKVEGRGVNGRIHTIDVEESAKSTELVKAAPAINASPVAKRMAADLGIALEGVQGSGAGGRISRDDVITAVRSRQPEQEELNAKAQRREEDIFVDRVPLAGVRRVIAQHMSGSAFSAPHVTLHTEVDATNLMAARQQMNESLAGEAKISYNALFVAITARALREFPQVNACMLEDEICQYADINVGLAVDTERGLLVPVVREADKLNVLAIQEEGDALIQRAVEGKSQSDDLMGGTFTITNLGMFGIDAFTPIINQPQAAILGVGRIVNKPVGVKGELVLQDRLTLSLSFDHRILDGAPAARFLQRIGQLVERPFALMM